jgi:ribosomal protein S18 acetylase RimI-like enzyme
MRLQVTELADPMEALDRARAFLLAQPIRHNVLLTALDGAVDLSHGGRFWLVEAGPDVVGFAVQSPPTRHVGVAPMPDDVVRALAEHIDAPIPGVVGEAAVAATFAGHFCQHHGGAIAAVEAGRLYELGTVEHVAAAPGALRLAAATDRSELFEWARAFAAETGTELGNDLAIVEANIAAQRIWVWDYDGPASMAGASKPAAGVSRVQRVYTPPERRGAGYATSCVEHLSRELIDRGQRCLLYTQMSNPTSNAIYRRIGYSAIAEVLDYSFAPD